jgi:4-hydroxybenzoate polyprenyltransferase
MSRPGKVRALLATLRIANAPSVVSNVFLGLMMGWIVRFHWIGSAVSAFDWSRGLLACCGGLLLYFSGNLANDWFDREWDATRRPERALPSGLFPPGSYLALSLLLAVSGIAVGFVLNFLSGCTAILICLLIGIYTWFHKKAIWAVIPMGLCRAGLYFFGFFAQWLTLAEIETFHREQIGPEAYLRTLFLPFLLAVGLFSYIAGLSLSARYEGMENPPQGPKVISLAMLILPLPAMSCVFMIAYHPLFGIAGMAPFIVWLALSRTRFKKPIPRYVSALLAGIPLVDFIAAFPLALGFREDLEADFIEISLLAVPQFLGLLTIPIAAFIAGRALQRLAPAT